MAQKDFLYDIDTTATEKLGEKSVVILLLMITPGEPKRILYNYL